MFGRRAFRRRTTSRALVCVALSGIALGGCSHSSHPPAAPQPTVTTTSDALPTPTRSSSPPSPLDIEFPPAVTARLLGHNYVRLPVPTADLSAEVNIHRGLLAALVDHGAFAGEVYPAISTNDGASWTITGPQFADSATCSTCTTSELTVGTRYAVIAWGPGGSFVKTTADLGVHWYAARFPHGVTGVRAHARRLYARAAGPEAANGTFPTREYVSSDNGRHWQRGIALGSVRRLR